MSTDCFIHKCDITLVTERCYVCGRFWSAERCGHNTTCPFCAKANVEQARAEEEKAKRAASSLKGAYSKLKKRVSR